jgi:two-component system sensor histidine kinase DegS
LPRETNHEIWRIIIESLNNVIKHANAADVLVKLVVKDEKLLVIVQDDGIGYDTQLATHGMGLKNMRLRADRLGGKLMMISLPGKGTQMSLEVPLIGKDIE